MLSDPADSNMQSMDLSNKACTVKFLLQSHACLHV